MIYEPPKGFTIYDAAKRAIEEATNCDLRIMLVFNELEVSVFPESCPNDIIEKYLLQNTIRRLKLGHED